MWCPGFGWPRGVEGVIAEGSAFEKRDVMEADGPIELVSVPEICQFQPSLYNMADMLRRQCNSRERFVKILKLTPTI